jgi:hypothetical protein
LQCTRSDEKAETSDKVWHFLELSSARWTSRFDWSLLGCPTLIVLEESESQKDALQLAVECQNGSMSIKTLPNNGKPLLSARPGLLNALISKFLVETAGLRETDPKYQLTHISPVGDKWSLKNYEKWKRTPCISQIVDGTLFRGMKAMREGDDEVNTSAIAWAQTMWMLN